MKNSEKATVLLKNIVELFSKKEFAGMVFGKPNADVVF